nr:hypothetical protein [Streptomyces antibioticus]
MTSRCGRRCREAAQDGERGAVRDRVAQLAAFVLELALGEPVLVAYGALLVGHSGEPSPGALRVRVRP